MSDEKKIFRSRKQKFYRGTDDPVDVKGLRTIVIENGNLH